MNPVLSRILSEKQVTDGQETFSLRHPEFPDRVSHISESTGELVQRAVRDVQPQLSLEVGLAYGISTLFICEAIAALPRPGRHIVLDPFQDGKWRGIGLRNLREAGYEPLLEFHEERSELSCRRWWSRDARWSWRSSTACTVSIRPSSSSTPSTACFVPAASCSSTTPGGAA